MLTTNAVGIQDTLYNGRSREVNSPIDGRRGERDSLMS